ncbi:hypothetical protein [Streptomyces kronopolitis]|uniref:hypothetical protein n=1 Tax=Streptomyces kronopolitis TaxID=1612435 RepID=UPI00342F9190
MDTSAASLRALRAALFTALCVTLSAASHVLLSRMPLPPATVGALCAAVFVIAYALAGPERGYWRIAALLVPLELAADLVFSLGQHACYGEAGGPLHSLGVELLCGGSPVGTPLAAPPGQSPSPVATWGVLLAAHLLIGLLAAGWLRRGEAALHQLLGAVAGFAFRPLLIAVAVIGATTAPRRPAPAPARAHRPARAAPLLVHCVVRRGPPCALAA